MHSWWCYRQDCCVCGLLYPSPGRRCFCTDHSGYQQTGTSDRQNHGMPHIAPCPGPDANQILRFEAHAGDACKFLTCCVLVAEYQCSCCHSHPKIPGEPPTAPFACAEWMYGQTPRTIVCFAYQIFCTKQCMLQPPKTMLALDARRGWPFWTHSLVVCRPREDCQSCPSLTPVDCARYCSHSHRRLTSMFCMPNLSGANCSLLPVHRSGVP